MMCRHNFAEPKKSVGTLHCDDEFASFSNTLRRRRINWVVHFVVNCQSRWRTWNEYVHTNVSLVSRKVEKKKSEHRESSYLPVGANTWDVGHAALKVEWHLRGWFWELASEGAETKRGFCLSTFVCVWIRCCWKCSRGSPISQAFSMLTHQAPTRPMSQVLGFWMALFFFACWTTLFSRSSRFLLLVLSVIESILGAYMYERAYLMTSLSTSYSTGAISKRFQHIRPARNVFLASDIVVTPQVTWWLHLTPNRTARQKIKGFLLTKIETKKKRELLVWIFNSFAIIRDRMQR